MIILYGIIFSIHNKAIDIAEMFPMFWNQMINIVFGFYFQVVKDPSFESFLIDVLFIWLASDCCSL